MQSQFKESGTNVIRAIPPKKVTTPLGIDTPLPSREFFHTFRPEIITGPKRYETIYFGSS